MAITNPTKYVTVQRLGRFEAKLAQKYQTKAIAAITGLSAETVEAALAELLGKINALPSSIVPKGTKAFAGLDPTTDLVAANVGFMYNISDAFETTADFVEGAGHAIPAGANVYIANPSTGVYKYDVFQGMYDLSGYALKSEMSVTPGTGTDADKTTIQLKSGLSKQVLIAHQDISGKADKDTDAVTGNFAIFDANGNPVDGNCKPADFQAAGDYKTTQTPVADPTADGTGIEFIDSISQDANGEITPHKKSVQAASDSQAGLMSAADFTKLAALQECSDDDIDSIFA